MDRNLHSFYSGIAFLNIFPPILIYVSLNGRSKIFALCFSSNKAIATATGSSVDKLCDQCKMSECTLDNGVYTDTICDSECSHTCNAGGGRDYHEINKNVICNKY